MRLKLGELPSTLREELTLTLKSYTVALLGLRPGNEGEIGEFVGTGTLVSVHGSYFVLTAAHVWKRLQRSPSDLMSLPDYRSRFVVETKAIQPTLADEARLEEWGPDIALLKLPLSVISRIRAHKTFRDLHKQESPYRGRPPSLRWGFVAITGVPAETSSAGERTLALKGGIFMSVIARRWRRGPYDYFDIPARDIGVDNVPRSFGGVSGGGLWQVILRRSRKTGALSWGRRLIGIAFYQSRVRHGNRFIRCHGPRSIFGVAVSRLVLPNNRLKLTARGRSAADARLRTRAAAYPGR